MKSSNSLSIAATLIACTLVQLSSGQSNTCRNPNSRRGTCIPLLECPPLLGAIQRVPLSDSVRNFAQQSQCTNGRGNQPFVCCTADVDFMSVETTSTPSPAVLRGTGEGLILPTAPACGQVPSSDRIYNGNDTLLDEFPWMVLLEYVQRNGQRLFNCGGSLINQRYVLTAAHCVTGAILRDVGRLDSVRLGEYDTTQDIDCVGKDCADPVVNMGVEASIPHPQFTDTNPSRQFDIALVRLNGVVRYTDFIKPICLPSGVGQLPAPRTGMNLVVAGWGRTLNARMSNIKQKLFVAINDQQECAQKFSAKTIQLSSSQLCAGGRFSEDSCDGDSGGPLMRLHGNYALEGVVSFGNKCGLENWPGVYTKVADFEPWIRSNIRA